MRIISWNMGCSFPGRYRRSHADAWRYLFGLQPDVVFVQEALRQAAPAVSLGTTVWSANRGQESATAVFVRSGAAVTPLEVRARASYVAAATVGSSIGPLLLASVHVGPGDYKENRRVVVQKLRKITASHRFVVGGDVNAARHWDTVYGGRTHAEFFATLDRCGFHDCHWAQHGREVQSFWGRQAKEAYQCDHIFTDPITGTGLVRDCTIIDNPEVRSLSDHGPLRLDLAIDLDLGVRSAN